MHQQVVSNECANALAPYIRCPAVSARHSVRKLIGRRMIIFSTFAIFGDHLGEALLMLGIVGRIFYVKNGYEVCIAFWAPRFNGTCKEPAGIGFKDILDFLGGNLISKCHCQ